jgi:hypothetical protein
LALHFIFHRRARFAGGTERENDMALLRIETERDQATGRFYLEFYYPADSSQPYVTTEPRYKTAAAAEADVIASMAVAANRAPG